MEAQRGAGRRKGRRRRDGRGRRVGRRDVIGRRHRGRPTHGRLLGRLTVITRYISFRRADFGTIVMRGDR